MRPASALRVLLALALLPGCAAVGPRRTLTELELKKIADATPHGTRGCRP